MSLGMTLIAGHPDSAVSYQKWLSLKLVLMGLVSTAKLSSWPQKIL